MKPISLFNSFSKLNLLVLLFFSISLFSCSDDSSNGSSVDGGTMTATINGEAWEAVQVVATFEGGVIGLAGTDLVAGNTRQINISGLITGEGTFPVAPISGLVGTYAQASSPSDVNPNVGTSGQLIITRLDDGGAAGTFQFSGQGFQVQSGSFEVEF